LVPCKSVVDIARWETYSGQPACRTSRRASRSKPILLSLPRTVCTRLSDRACARVKIQSPEFVWPVPGLLHRSREPPGRNAQDNRRRWDDRCLQTSLDRRRRRRGRARELHASRARQGRPHYRTYPASRSLFLRCSSPTLTPRAGRLLRAAQERPAQVRRVQGQAHGPGHRVGGRQRLAQRPTQAPGLVDKTPY